MDLIKVDAKFGTFLLMLLSQKKTLKKWKWTFIIM